MYDCQHFSDSILCILTGKAYDVVSFAAQESNATVFLSSASESKIGMCVLASCFFFFPHLYNIFSDSFKVNPYELRCISNFYVSIIFVTIYKCFIHFIWIYKVNFQMRLPMRLHLVLSGFLLSDSLCKHYRS